MLHLRRYSGHEMYVTITSMPLANSIEDKVEVPRIHGVGIGKLPVRQSLSSLRFVPDDGEPTARIICPRWRRRPGKINATIFIIIIIIII